MASAIELVTERIGNIGGANSAPGNGSGGFGGRGVEKTLGAQLKKIAGIDLGIGALLKQSQIFTGYLGNIFAIVGAMIDTILAPLAPIAFKALADLGKKIPAIAAMAEKLIPKVVTFLGSIVKGIDAIGKFFHRDWAKWMGLSLAALIGIRIAVSTATMTGGMARSAIGLRGGYLTQGISALRGGGGAAATTAATTATRAATATRGLSSTQIRMQRAQLAQQTATRQAQPLPMKGAQGAGRLARFGGLARVGAGAGGGLIGGITGYAGGRSQGMSQGTSIGRGVAGGVGGAAGAALGSFAGPAGMMIGGMAGSALSTMLFDKMFGDKAGKAGGRTDESGQIGLAGYSAPMVVARAAQKFSDNVEESGEILANSVLKHADGVTEAAKVPPHVMEEMKKMVQEDIDSVKAFHRAALSDLAQVRKIHSTAGKEIYHLLVVLEQGKLEVVLLL